LRKARFTEEQSDPAEFHEQLTELRGRRKTNPCPMTQRAAVEIG